MITGEEDFHIPYTQAICGFTALRHKGIPGEPLAFRDQSHRVLKPKNSLQWHPAIFNWLDRRLAAGSGE